MSSLRTKLGQKIRRYRLKKHLTQAALAELTGIDYKYVQKIEGKNPPALRIDTIAKIAKALKVSLADLMDLPS